MDMENLARNIFAARLEAKNATEATKSAALVRVAALRIALNSFGFGVIVQEG